MSMVKNNSPVVLHINSMSKGGAATAAINLHLGLIENNFKSKLLLKTNNTDNIPEVYSFTDITQPLTNRVQNSLRNRFQNQFFKSQIKLFGKIQFLNSDYDITLHPIYKNADIIHLHWANGFLNWNTFFKNCHKPIVWTLHDMGPFSGGYYYKTNKTNSKKAYKIENRIEKNKLKILKKNKNLHIVSPSLWLKEKAEQSTVFAHLNHYNIPNCLNTSIFCSKKSNPLKEYLKINNFTKVVLFVASSVKDTRKGFYYLQESLKYIKQDIHVIVIGELKEKIKLPFKHTVTGKINNIETISQYYNIADVFVNPAIEDNLPNTVLESISCGTPVVGFKIGGMPDMIQNGENGFLSDEISVSSLANEINKCLNTNFDRNKIAKNAKERYSWEKISSIYYTLYKKILNKEELE